MDKRCDLSTILQALQLSCFNMDFMYHFLDHHCCGLCSCLRKSLSSFLSIKYKLLQPASSCIISALWLLPFAYASAQSNSSFHPMVPLPIHIKSFSIPELILFKQRTGGLYSFSSSHSAHCGCVVNSPFKEFISCVQPSQGSQFEYEDPSR